MDKNFEKLENMNLSAEQLIQLIGNFFDSSVIAEFVEFCEEEGY